MRAFIAGWGLLLCLAARAEGDIAPLDLRTVLQSAERHHPVVLSALQEQQEAAALLRSAEGGFDPSLRLGTDVEPGGPYPKRVVQVKAEQPIADFGGSVMLSYERGRGSFASYDGERATADDGLWKAGVKVPLLRDAAVDRRRTALVQAEAALDGSTANLAQQQIDIRRQAALRYWDWIAAGLRLGIADRWLALATTRDTALRQRVDAGDIPEIDHVENQRSVLQRRSARINAERELQQAALELSLFYRDTEGQPIIASNAALPKTWPPLAEVDAALPLGLAEARALRLRPELARLTALRERSAADAKLAANQQQPALDLSLLGKRPMGAGTDKLTEPSLEIGVSVDIPLRNRAATGREQAANAQLARLAAQTQLQGDRIRAEVRNAHVAIQAQRQRAEIAAEELKTANALALGEWERYQLGEGNLLLVNLREQTMAEAALREVEAAADLRRAQEAYRAAIAADLDPPTP